MSSYPEEEDAVLNCISQILLEEDMEEGTYVFPDATVEAAERSFSDALGEKISSEHQLITPRNYVLSQVHNTFSCNYYGRNSLNVVTAKNLDQPYLLNDVFSVHESCSYIPALPVIDNNFQLSSTPHANNKVLFDFEGNRLIPLKLKEVAKVVSSKEDKGKSRYDHSNSGLMKRKSLNQLEIETSARGRNKYLAVNGDDSELSETFDMVLLSDGWQNGLEMMSSHQSRSLSEGANIYGKTRKKKCVGGGYLLDLRALLAHCAEAVSGNDRETAIDLLLQIRRNSSFSGNASQRIAHYFANALEARLNGIGNELFTALSAKSISILTSLKSCRLFLSACPLIKLSNFFVNHTILELTEKANTFHIIHFGILYGFQWPSLIQRLSLRPGGPPLLRITGIDLPLPGFRPAARLEETGHRLANYCKRFNVPFQYTAIAQRWENISHEDLKINKDEITVVNCLYRFRYLLDDSTAGLNSSRDAVLSLIKSINPDIFIHGIVNGAYNAPFFLSRFKEALYYYSTVFDKLEVNTSPELEQDRRVYEQECFGKEILNVVACEGSKRIERPETYKQWHARNVRVGLRQLPLNQEIMRKVKEQMKSCYHKDFLVEEDSQWMLQGWKGRVLYALSCWKPA